MSLSGSRQREGLSEHEIQRCIDAWENIDGKSVCRLETNSCKVSGSKTVFVQRADDPHVKLGADVLPNPRLLLAAASAVSARQRLSLVACLAHELAHAVRYIKYGIDRSVEHPDVYLDEAEASIEASYNIFLEENDRQDLIEDARDQLNEWMKARAAERS